jgi:single-strand DNA-binding protein
MAGLNKVCLIGQLGRDPEVRNLNNGGKVVNFSMATSESWRDKATGERKDKTEWHNIVIFNEKLGEVAERFLKKGSKVYLEGALQTREFTDKDGNQRKSTEVVLQRFRGELTLLDSRKDGERTSEAPAREKQPFSGRSAPETNRSGGRPSMSAALDDDIPFMMEWR